MTKSCGCLASCLKILFFDIIPPQPTFVNRLHQYYANKIAVIKLNKYFTNILLIKHRITLTIPTKYDKIKIVYTDRRSFSSSRRGEYQTMKKTDSAVIKATAYIASVVLIFSVLMQAVFLVIGKWHYTVLLGNLLGGSVAVFNFFLMGLTVQRAVKMEEKDAKTAIKAPQSLRMVMLFVVAAVGVLLPCFHTVSVLIPLLFPRIAIALQPIFTSKKHS